MKSLHQMSAEELGRLFPVVLSEYDPQWKDRFLEEKRNILRFVSSDMVAKIEHIGSTAIPGIKAKPVIDILLELNMCSDLLAENLKQSFTGNEYHYIAKPENPPPHMMFVKGYTCDGYKGQAFHVHVRLPGTHDECRFRDKLIQDHECAREYENLKIQLARKFPFNRDAYTDGKTAFIEDVVRGIPMQDRFL